MQYIYITLCYFVCIFRRLYWVDAHNKSVESSDLDGNSRHKECSLLGSMYAAPLFGLAVINDMAYMSTWYDGAVYSTQLGLGHTVNIVITEVDYLTDREMFSLAAATELTQPPGEYDTEKASLWLLL